MAEYNFEQDAKDNYHDWCDYKRLELIITGQNKTHHPDITRIDNTVLINGDAKHWLPMVQYGAIVTDPPYGMALPNGTSRFKTGKILGDETPDLLTWTCGLPAKWGKYCFMRWDNLYDVPKPNSLITWIKENHSIGDLHTHARRYESIAFYKGEEHEWARKKPDDVIKAFRQSDTTHPSEKPVELFSWLLSLIPKHIPVIDPFMGSGASALAAKQTGHVYYGIELDPQYYNLTVERMNEPYQPKFEGFA